MNNLYEIQYLDIKPDKKYDEIISKVVKECFRVENLLDSKLYISITLTTPENIQKYNKQYRNLDKPTDVLSFPMIEYEFSEDFSKLEDESVDCFNQDNGELLLGDIILNIDRIKSQSEEFNHSIYRELAFLTAHSMLHLFGHDHIDEAQRIIMEEKQEEILNMKGYTRDYEEK